MLICHDSKIWFIWKEMEIDDMELKSICVGQLLKKNAHLTHFKWKMGLSNCNMELH